MLATDRRVFDVKSGESWTRKDVVVADNHQKLLCKLWSDFSEAPVEVGQTVKLINMSVNHYNKNKATTAADRPPLSDGD